MRRAFPAAADRGREGARSSFSLFSLSLSLVSVRTTVKSIRFYSGILVECRNPVSFAPWARRQRGRKKKAEVERKLLSLSLRHRRTGEIKLAHSLSRFCSSFARKWHRWRGSPRAPRSSLHADRARSSSSSSCSRPGEAPRRSRRRRRLHRFRCRPPPPLARRICRRGGKVRLLLYFLLLMRIDRADEELPRAYRMKAFDSGKRCILRSSTSGIVSGGPAERANPNSTLSLSLFSSLLLLFSRHRPSFQFSVFLLRTNQPNSSPPLHRREEAPRLDHQEAPELSAAAGRRRGGEAPRPSRRPSPADPSCCGLVVGRRAALQRRERQARSPDAAPAARGLRLLPCALHRRLRDGEHDPEDLPADAGAALRSE